MMMPVRARWRALPRALRWPLLALITLYAGYVLLGNLLLNTPLGPAALNRSPDKFAMQSGTGLTWWPGRLVLWNVDLQGQSTRTNWKVSAQRMSGGFGYSHCCTANCWCRNCMRVACMAACGPRSSQRRNRLRRRKRGVLRLLR